jgi:hypothetical protein
MTRLWTGVPLAAVVLLAGRPAAAEPPRPPPVDQARVDAAVDRGAKFLLAKAGAGPLKIAFSAHAAVITADEIALYALVYCGVNEQTPEFKALLDRVVARENTRVYPVALKAMALEAIDAGRFQDEIAACAQFLLDNQCENGQWGYGKPVPKADVVRTPGAKRPAGGGSDTKALPVIALRRRAKGPAEGDNSNTQYALLALRSCLMAGVRFPLETFAESEKFWEKDQNKDGGWGYSMKAMASPRDDSYASMTAGAVGSLALCKFYLGRDAESSASIRGGIAWLAKNWSLSEVKGLERKRGETWVFYHDYAVERLGIFLQKEIVGGHAWYPEGVEFLQGAQKPDGSWTAGDDTVPETCFAILFLRRATKALAKVQTR